MEPSGGEEPTCCACTSLLMEPYIQCAACTHANKQTDTQTKVTLCLHCFAKGVEFGGHESDHPYSVVKNNFPLFERLWTAQEEMQLLKAVADCGHGNWSDVAQKVRTKNGPECERHFNSCYINNPADPLPNFPEPELSYFPCPVVFKLCEDPPRPAEGSQVTTEMAGYMAGRGDFMTEYDNYTEVDLRHLEFDPRGEEDPLETDLKLAVVQVYQNCLRERRRRKRVIRRYGLINLQKNLKFRHWYERTLGGEVIDRLRAFAQLVSPDQYYMYLESLNYEQELRRDITSLQDYRHNGLSKLRHIGMFTRLQKAREKERCERHLLSDVINHIRDETACQTWLQRQATFESIGKGTPALLPNAPRRAAPPLDITCLPGYDRLNAKERELCSRIRLVPLAFHEFKSLLVTECNKLGSLKLAQARQLIKIDVNKTRKIYDFLASEGLLNRDCS